MGNESGGDRPLVSLCMLVRDEEAQLERAIRSALPLADEVVVVDTGSRDGTIGIARGLGAAVFELPWEDNFAQARNASLDRARGEWALVLDGDEELDLAGVDGAALREQLLAPGGPDGYLVRVECPHSTKVGEGARKVEERLAVRLFRNDGSLRYQYPTHSQLMTDGRALAPLSLRVVNHGHEDPAVAKRKAERNLKLLKRMEPTHPHRLEQEARLSFALGRYGEVPLLWRRLRAHHGGDLPADLSELSFLAFLAHALQGEMRQAEDVLLEALTTCPGDTDLRFAYLLLAGMRYLDASARSEKAESTLRRQPSRTKQFKGQIMSLLEEMGMDVMLAGRKQSKGKVKAVPCRVGAKRRG